MQKVAIIGAGNVGGQTALFLLQQGISHIVLLDVAAGLARGKALDLQDCASSLKKECVIEGSDDFSLLNECGIVVITAGLSRRPGMTRDDLLKKNSEIVKELALKVKTCSPGAIVIVVTNPVDVMTYVAAKVTAFGKKKVLGMGISLDAARFTNIIHQKLNMPISAIDAVVIGSHGQTMVPAPGLTRVSRSTLSQLLSKEAVGLLAQATVERGAAIVEQLGSGSAYFAPAAAIADIIKAIVHDEKRLIGVCACLDGEYGIDDLCVGVPAVIGRHGVEKVQELQLPGQEKEAFLKSSDSIRQQIAQLAL